MIIFDLDGTLADKSEKNFNKGNKVDMNEEIFKSILGKFNECQETCECKEKQDNKKNTDKILHERHRALSRDLDRCHSSLVAMMHSYLTLVKEVKEMESILRERSGESDD